jgi:hypothetical protein
MPGSGAVSLPCRVTRLHTRRGNPQSCQVVCRISLSQARPRIHPLAFARTCLQEECIPCPFTVTLRCLCEWPFSHRLHLVARHVSSLFARKECLRCHVDRRLLCGFETLRGRMRSLFIDLVRVERGLLPWRLFLEGRR